MRESSSSSSMRNWKKKIVVGIGEEEGVNIPPQSSELQLSVWPRWQLPLPEYELPRPETELQLLQLLYSPQQHWNNEVKLFWWYQCMYTSCFCFLNMSLKFCPLVFLGLVLIWNGKKTGASLVNTVTWGLPAPAAPSWLSQPLPGQWFSVSQAFPEPPAPDALPHVCRQRK